MVKKSYLVSFLDFSIEVTSKIFRVFAQRKVRYPTRDGEIRRGNFMSLIQEISLTNFPISKFFSSEMKNEVGDFCGEFSILNFFYPGGEILTLEQKRKFKDLSKKFWPREKKLMSLFRVGFWIFGRGPKFLTKLGAPTVFE